MTKETIDKINSKCIYKDLDGSYEGILIEPNGIPIDIKEPVVYMRWKTGFNYGYHCNTEDDDDYGYESCDRPNFSIIELILREFNKPIVDVYYNFSSITHDKYEEDKDYYGNGGEYKIEYIILSELKNLIFKTK